MTKKTV